VSIFRDTQRIAQQRSWSPNDDIKLLVSIINIFHLFTDARQFLGMCCTNPLYYYYYYWYSLNFTLKYFPFSLFLPLFFLSFSLMPFSFCFFFGFQSFLLYIIDSIWCDVVSDRSIGYYDFGLWTTCTTR
jgi:hypothetical protein